MMEYDRHLDETAILQYAWKNRRLQLAVCSIVKKSLENPVFLADEVVFENLGPDDRNIIGIAFRIAAKLGIVRKTGSYNKSRSKASNGRIIWEYRLESKALAHAFMRANDYKKLVAETSPELPLS